MYAFLIGSAIAGLFLLVGAVITWRIARNSFPDRARPGMSGGVTLGVVIAILLVAYLIQPKPCITGLPGAWRGPSWTIWAATRLPLLLGLTPLSASIKSPPMLWPPIACNRKNSLQKGP